MKVNTIKRLIFIVVLIIGMFLLPDNTPLPIAQVSVLPSNNTLEQFETSEVGIHIDPMGTYIAGVQLDIAFDKDQLRVNKITEGDIFKQNGANTSFNNGVVSNLEGTVKNIYDFIIGNSNISNPGIFININLTVINSSGFSGINISNVIISGPQGNLMAVNVTNGSIYTTKAAGTITGKVTEIGNYKTNLLSGNTKAASDKISPDVRSLMLKGENVQIIVIMNNQTSFNSSSPEKVVPLLKEHSKNSQRSFVSLIKEEKNRGNAQKIKQFWIVNAMSLHASPEFIERLSKRDDIASVELDSEFVTKEDYSVRISGSTKDNATSEIKQINATKAWEFGIAGKGINVSVIDTGINPSHPDIAGRVTGWMDFVGNQTLPYDNHGHGTHVAGTVAGNGNGGITTGVAPDANLFGVKVLDGAGSGHESDIIDGIQWSIENKADIISMSLGSYELWLTPNCDANNYAMATSINNAINAGVVVVAAAGNSPGGVSSPGCIGGTIAVGAVNSSDTITYFSGRGNALADHGLVAPGYGITSLDYLTSGYAIKSGTSMATPHVSGAVAVLLQAARNNGVCPSPVQVKSILENTSKDLGTAGKDNLYGAGRIDVFESIRNFAIYTINGTVEDHITKTGIANAIISINTSISTVTDASGFYSLTVNSGTYNLTVKSDPTYNVNNMITVSTIGTTFVKQDIELVRKPTGTITGNAIKV